MWEKRVRKNHKNEKGRNMVYLRERNVASYMSERCGVFAREGCVMFAREEHGMVTWKRGDA